MTPPLGPVPDDERARAVEYLESLRRRERARVARLAQLSGSISARRRLAEQFAPVVKRPEERP